MLCVIRSMLMPYFSRRPRSRLRICAWTDTSSAEVGSSRIRSFGFVEIARAMATRCRWPPDSSCGYRSSKNSGRPTSRRSSRARISASARVQNRVESIGSEMISASLIRGFSEEYGSWKTMLASRRRDRSSDDDRRRRENRSAMASTRFVTASARAFSYSTSSESGMSNRISPSLGLRRRIRQRPTVLFPEPLSPTRPTTCSFCIFKPMSSTAFNDVVDRNAPRIGKNLLSPYAAIITLLRLVEPTGDELIVAVRQVDRDDFVTLLEGERTARVKGASRGHGAHVRYVSFNPLDGFRLERRDRGDEQLRVRMQRLLENLVRRSDLDDAARVHDGNPVADFRKHGEIMRNDDEGGAHRSSDSLDQLQNLRLDGDIHRAGRLIHDDDFRIVRQGNRDDHALAHPAGELVRIHLHDALRVVDPQGGQELSRLAVSLFHQDATHDARKDRDARVLRGNRAGTRHDLDDL